MGYLDAGPDAADQGQHLRHARRRQWADEADRPVRAPMRQGEGIKGANDPVWSPSGTQIMYTRFFPRDDEKTELVAMNPDGSGKHVVIGGRFGNRHRRTGSTGARTPSRDPLSRRGAPGSARRPPRGRRAARWPPISLPGSRTELVPEQDYVSACPSGWRSRPAALETACVPGVYRGVGAFALSTGTEPRLIGRPGPRPRRPGGPDEGSHDHHQATGWRRGRTRRKVAAFSSPQASSEGSWPHPHQLIPG